MPRGQCKFTQTDIKRGIKAIESAGLKVGRVEIQEGKIILFPVNSDEAVTTNEAKSDDIVL